MDISGGSTSPGAQVIQYYWNEHASQQWTVLPTNSGYAELVNVNSGECLSVASNSSTPGTDLIQWPCYGSPGQQWYLGNSGTYPGWSEAFWTVGVQSQLNPGQYAEVQDQVNYPGGVIDEYTWTGAWNQFWNITWAS
jgi:endoglucanase